MRLSYKTEGSFKVVDYLTSKIEVVEISGDQPPRHIATILRINDDIAIKEIMRNESDYVLFGKLFRVLISNINLCYDMEESCYDIEAAWKCLLSQKERFDMVL